MAFIKKAGTRYNILHGVTGEIISRHTSRALAKKRLAAMHRKSKPKPANRGKAAAKKHANRRRK